MQLKDFVTGTYGTMYYVTDMKKAVAYYTDVLGRAPASESPEWTTFEVGGTNLCLHLADNVTDGKGIIIFNSKNLKETTTTLKSMGVEFFKDYHQVCEGGYAIDIKDPSGNTISFFEYTGA